VLTVERIRALPEGRKARVIVLVEGRRERRLEPLEASGGITFLTKPNEPENLEEAIRVQLGYVGK
jgi:CheY-like chemotaxis protein